MAFVFKGAYKAATSYSRYDAVSSGDTIVIADNITDKRKMILGE